MILVVFLWEGVPQICHREPLIHMSPGVMIPAKPLNMMRHVDQDGPHDDGEVL